MALHAVNFNHQTHSIPDNMIGVVTRAVSPIMNLNYDEFTPEELSQACNTFIDKPVFVDHTYLYTDGSDITLANNQGMDLNRSRGHVEDAMIDETGTIQLLIYVDRDYTLLCDLLTSGAINAVSMGCDCLTTCNICDMIVDEENPCAHYPALLGAQYWDGNIVHDVLHHIQFTEISFVFDPADPSALISRVVC